MMIRLALLLIASALPLAAHGQSIVRPNPPRGALINPSDFDPLAAAKLDWNAGNPSAYTINLTPPTAGLGPVVATTQTLSGTATDQNFANNQYIAGDTINLGPGFSVGWSMTHLFGGSAAQGGRIAVTTKLRQTAPTANSNVNRNYVALDAGVESLNSSGDGGTDLGSGARGAYFAISPYFRCFGTNLLECTGGEVNSFQEPGSSVAYKNIWSLVGGGPEDAVQGTVFDTMLALSNQAGSVGFRDGILVGNMNGQFPLNSNSTIMRTIGGTVGNGIDLSTTTFLGAPLVLPGMNVSNGGKVYASGLSLPLSTPASSSAACTTGTASWDTGYVYVCTATNTWKRAALATW